MRAHGRERSGSQKDEQSEFGDWRTCMDMIGISICPEVIARQRVSEAALTRPTSSADRACMSGSSGAAVAKLMHTGAGVARHEAYYERRAEERAALEEVNDEELLAAE